MSDVLTALAVCVEPQNLFVNLFCGFPTGLIYLWFVQAICPPKSDRLYWGANTSYLLVLVLFKPLYSPAMRMVVGVTIAFLLPVLTTRGGLARRAIVCILCMLLQFATELVAVLIWTGLTGLGAMDNQLALQHAGAFLLAMSSGHLILLPLLLTGLKCLCDRYFPEKADAVSKNAAPRWLRRFVLLPFLQLLFLYLVVGITFDVMRAPLSFVLVSLSLLVLCAIADILLLVQLNRSMRKREADVEAALLEERVAGYLRDMAEVQSLLSDTAKLRHDLRNHLAVVQLMAARGEYAEARAYLEEARAAVGK